MRLGIDAICSWLLDPGGAEGALHGHGDAGWPAPPLWSGVNGVALPLTITDRELADLLARLTATLSRLDADLR